MDWKKTSIFSAGIFSYAALLFLLWRLFMNREAILGFVGERDILGPAIIILLHLIQSVVFILPGSVVSFASGYAFGAPVGFLINLAGTLAGTTLLFILARRASSYFGYSGIVRKEMPELREILKRAKSRRRAYILAKMMPLIPPDVVTVFVASFTRNSLREFLVFSTIGALPKMIAETLAGSFLKEYGITGWQTIALLAGITVLFLAGILWEKRFYSGKPRASR